MLHYITSAVYDENVEEAFKAAVELAMQHVIADEASVYVISQIYIYNFFYRYDMASVPIVVGGNSTTKRAIGSGCLLN